MPHLHMNSFSGSPWLIMSHRSNLLSFTANRVGICSVCSESLFTALRRIKVVCIFSAGVHQGWQQRRLKLPPPLREHGRSCPPHPTPGPPRPLFEVQRRKKPLKMIAFMLKASKRRDGQAVIVCSGLVLGARHQ